MKLTVACGSHSLSPCPLDRKRKMKPIILMVLALALTLTRVTHASDAMDAERDFEAMKSITEAFCEAKKICENKEHGEFTVYRYYADEIEKLLSPAEMRTIESCKEKYQVKMTTGKAESIHIYCYDNSKPRLLLEKHLADK